MGAMKNIDSIPSFILILIGVLFCTSSSKLGIGKLNKPGPGFLPFVVAAILILLSLGVILGGRHIKHAESKFNGRRSGVALLVLLSLFAYVLILDILGFVLATFLMLTLLFSIPEKQSWKMVLGASLFTAACTYLLFGYTLGITLPTGFLGF
jgi:putative tricarboxylic transport membrane protein